MKRLVKPDNRDNLQKYCCTRNCQACASDQYSAHCYSRLQTGRGLSVRDGNVEKHFQDSESEVTYCHKFLGQADLLKYTMKYINNTSTILTSNKI